MGKIDRRKLKDEDDRKVQVTIRIRKKTKRKCKEDGIQIGPEADELISAKYGW